MKNLLCKLGLHRPTLSHEQNYTIVSPGGRRMGKVTIYYYSCQRCHKPGYHVSNSVEKSVGRH